ncbi:MAG: DUF5063 domain-containing protein [Firmicutes bacterium]|nr:DUF5063 domain-containing protein [Bacillota bacterium]MCM1401647.1 DUF5063 domain-containing protein [Bacteroides sp.]MCM1477533.1 DUF5063 domain-containing protein [Bacteroides sp.]
MNLSPNSLAFIALCNEYCAAMESAATDTPEHFAQTMLRLLPRLYISATDIKESSPDPAYIDEAMDEEMYETVRGSVAALLGEHDTYLEVFEDDMKYSDTPIAVSVSEGLTDIMQPLYNFVELAKDAPVELVEEALASVADDFRNYWSRLLCNQLRAINALLYSGAFDE